MSFVGHQSKKRSFCSFFLQYNWYHCSISRIICNILSLFTYTLRLANQKNVYQCTNRILSFSYMYVDVLVISIQDSECFRTSFFSLCGYFHSTNQRLVQLREKEKTHFSSSSSPLSLLGLCKKAKSIHIAYLIEDVCESTPTCTCLAFVSVYSPGLHQQHREQKKKKKNKDLSSYDNAYQMNLIVYIWQANNQRIDRQVEKKRERERGENSSDQTLCSMICFQLTT